MTNLTEAERLVAVETKLDGVAENIKEIKKDFKNDTKTITNKLDEFETAFTKKIDDLDSKFAAKWVQSAAVGLISLILGAVVTAIVGLVILKPSDTTNIKVTDVSEPQRQSEKPDTQTSASPQVVRTQQPTSTETRIVEKTTEKETASPNNDDKSSGSGGVQLDLPKLLRSEL